MTVLVFDIETIPDVDAGRKLNGFESLSDIEVSQAMLAHSQAERNTTFLKHHLHQIVAISLVLATPQKTTVWSLGEEDSTEAELIQRFFDGLERYTPTLVSWNGSGFDLPVLHYRSLRHGIQAPTYWETGSQRSEFKWNNYVNRYHERHTDLMDLLALYQPRAYVPLDEMATLLGFPGKMGMSGDKVFEAYHAGKLKHIRDYCETDVLNTYLVYLQFQHTRGLFTDIELENAHQRLKTHLKEAKMTHLDAFLKTWESEGPPHA